MVAIRYSSDRGPTPAPPTQFRPLLRVGHGMGRMADQRPTSPCCFEVRQWQVPKFKFMSSGK
ncbi:hypothetical protein CTA2_2827 [Colletotrichum tanaceti]|uniref:Uncharacterized protein n=1 Tax=Colletotrichum tanaceti TaxID=1306861 RepID=A0A4U6X7Y8_9PEZI|nr:hypothetical protein CTA2_2827 [Colletotrichum tanaceti]TKW49627.1 hypothetical protein CTA1_6117 [Colletotrichum tanaceti]